MESTPIPYLSPSFTACPGIYSESHSANPALFYALIGLSLFLIVRALGKHRRSYSLGAVALSALAVALVTVNYISEPTLNRCSTLSDAGYSTVWILGTVTLLLSLATAIFGARSSRRLTAPLIAVAVVLAVVQLAIIAIGAVDFGTVGTIGYPYEKSFVIMQVILSLPHLAVLGSVTEQRRHRS